MMPGYGSRLIGDKGVVRKFKKIDILQKASNSGNTGVWHNTFGDS